MCEQEKRKKGSEYYVVFCQSKMGAGQQLGWHHTKGPHPEKTAIEPMLGNLGLVHEYHQEMSKSDSRSK